MKKTIIIALGLSLCLISCKKEEATPKWTPEKYTASIEAVNTKTALSGDALQWVEGDAISVFDADGKNFKFVAATGGTTAEFVQSEETPDKLNLEGLVCAVYPYSDTTVYENGDISVVLPSTFQEVSGFMASPKAGILTAKMDASKKFEFKSLCSYVCVTIPEGMDLASAYIFCSHADGTNGITGKINATIGSDGTPIINSIEDPEDGGVNVCGPESGFIPAGKYFIPILPGDYRGIRAKLDFGAESIEQTILSSDIFKIEDFTATRNSVVNFGEIYDTRNGFTWLDFEDSKLPGKTVIPEDRAGEFSVVENPVKSGKNTSNYVLKQFKASGSTSGYFQFAGLNSSVFKRVKTIKVQICLKDIPEKYYPRLKFNGSGTAYLPTAINGVTPVGNEFTQAEMKDAYDWEGWNEIEFSVSLAGDTSIKSFQLRPMCYSTGNNVQADNSIVYFDNVQFLYK